MIQRDEKIDKFADLLIDYLDKLGHKTKIYNALSDVLPFGKGLIGEEISAYSRGQIYGSSAHSNHANSMSYEQSRQRRSLILYSLGVKEDSDLIRVLRELDPKTEYPPKERPERMNTRFLKSKPTLYQKIIALSPEDKLQVGELVDRLYVNSIENKKE
ncbi:hypothetical protein HOC35_04960 [Candidatus Woesearchaeota archaeon]|jgi:hypothetical protein|nr:hypothetical protein [Candidatus Woesearchaeota archaeon]